MIIKTYDPKKGYEVKAGTVIGNVFKKDVVRSKHFFRLVNGYGIQADVYQKLLLKGVKKIVIKETDTKRILVSDINDWKQHNGHGNWGNGTQYVLSEQYMELQNKTSNQIGLL